MIKKSELDYFGFVHSYVSDLKMGNPATKFDSCSKKELIKDTTKFNPADPPPILTDFQTKLLREVWETIKDDIHRVGVITFVKVAMGINLVKCGGSVQESGNKAFDPLAPEPVIPLNQVRILTEMWRNLKEDITNVGVITFVNLFETHPEVQNVFMSFRAKDTSDLEYNHILRAHALRVMGTVDKCIYRLDNRDKLRDLMMDLGIRHKNYTVKIEYIDLMGPQFISSIKPHLENMWTEEHERAWENLFQLMCYYMKKGMCSI